MADLAQIENAARAAYIFGLPYIEMARTRAAFLRDGRPTGRFVHTRRLTTVADRWVTTPNNDTLYSSAWLDLGQGPVALDTPEFGARDWSVALLAMTTTNFAIPGTRSHGNRPGRFLIVGPGWEGDAGDRVVLRAPTRWVWALARIVVDGAADEAAVHGVQDGLVLTPTAARWAPELPAALKKDDAVDFYRQLAELLMESPPGDADRDAVAACATLGLMAGRHFSTGGLAGAQIAAMVKGYSDGVAQVRGGGAMGARAEGGTDIAASPNGLTIAALLIVAAQAPLGSTLIAVALPSISQAFSADLVLVTGLLVTAYLTINVVGQGPGGKLSDVLGHTNTFQMGIALYALGALIGVLAPAIWLLVVSRCTMAAAGALVVPSTLALLRVHMPAERQGRVFGLFGATMGFSAAVGPVLGGELVALFGWRSIFLASLPFLAFAGLLLRLWPLPPARPPVRPPVPIPGGTRGRFDLAGIMLLTVALSMFIAATKQDGLARALLLGLAVMLAVTFVVWELGAHAPVLDPRLFDNSAFTAGTLITALHNFAMYGLLFQLPQFFGTFGNAAPLEVGAMLFAMMIGMVVTAPIGGRLTDRFGARVTALAGMAPLLAGVLLLSRLAGFTAPIDAVAGLFLCGIGLGLCSAPAQSSAMASVGRERAGMAAGTSSTMRYLGGIASILVLGLVLGNNELVTPARHVAMIWIFAVAVAGSALLASWLPGRARADG